LGDSKPENWGHDLARKKILEMMSSGIPPINTSVRLARMEMSDADQDIPDNYTGNLLPAKMPQFAFFGVSIIGNLCFEVIAGVVGLERYLRWVDNRNLRFVRVWPTRDYVVDWPPSKTLFMKQVDQMRQAFMSARNMAVKPLDPRRRTWDLNE
jgi:hypothetical protein